jgi:EAL and modified HD-GYP domain-containing signal transduction protein
MNAASLATSRSFDTDLNDVYIACQPILDKQCNVVAYELLFRPMVEDVANAPDVKPAMLSIINSAFASIDIQSALGNKKAYVNLDAKSLREDFVDLLPAKRFVLETVEISTVDDPLLERLKNLKSHGYCIALNDFDNEAGKEPLLVLCDIVKLDVSVLSQATFVQHTQRLSTQGKQILAKQVNTAEQFTLCESLGCNLFQGGFFAKPVKLIQSDIPASTLRILDIMNNIVADADIAFLERAISHEVSLSYKLLQFVNSAGLSCGRELRTVKQALSMLGRNQLYRWLSLMLYTSKDDGLNQTDALLNAALYRGRLLELFSEYTDLENPNELFVLGTFSYLEALLNRDMESILKDISMPAPIKHALLEQDGRYWPFFNLALSIERDDVNDIRNAAKPLGLTLADINRAQLEALVYCEALS